jgi:transposase-like protein
MKFAFKTIQEFNDAFRDEKTCYEAFEKLRWNGIPVCPHCGSLKTPYKVKARGKFQDIPSYRCSERACDLPFTVRTKSIFEGSKVELRKWFQAAYEITVCKNGISSVELGNRIDVSQKTAWFINHRLRDMLTETEPVLLRDYVALDETSIGGKNKNRHADKKISGSHGRSSKGKSMVFAARGLRGQVKTKVVPNAESDTLIPMVESWVEKGAIICTDEWQPYNPLSKDYLHVRVNHSHYQYVNGAFSTNGVENFWSLLKRGIVGTHHFVSPKHLQRYANEFADRYNQKDRTNIERLQSALGRCSKERITYRELTRTKIVGE